jgi:DNA-binding transcriptional regulator GbsR (MarR family)
MTAAAREHLEVSTDPSVLTPSGAQQPASPAADAPILSPTLPATLPPGLLSAQDRFIATWGQMGTTWGISRTMAEVHALLFISGQPLCTDEAMERLRISRGNASMSLRALVDWGVVQRVHKRGDRKEYFAAEQDVWAMLQAILRERMRREIHPVLAALAEIRDQTDPKHARRGEPPSAASASPSAVVEPSPEAAAHTARHNARLDALLELLRIFDQLGSRLLELPTADLRATADALTSHE